MNIAITTTEDIFTVACPYSPEFPSEARALHGRWDAEEKTWTFDVRDKDRVLALLDEIYAWTPTMSGEIATVRMTLPTQPREGWWQYEQAITIAGRIIAKRWQRDQNVMLGDNVLVVDGNFAGKGGSVKNPRIGEASRDITLEWRDIPTEILDRIPFPYEIITQTTDYETLLEEKARLLKRLAEIDALLEP